MPSHYVCRQIGRRGIRFCLFTPESAIVIRNMRSSGLYFSC
nr:MAG TPA: hypothetical protein [Caudoviricetes sp.]